MRRALPDAAAAVGTLLVAASAWLFWPKERAGESPSLPPLRVVLVDTSASAVLRRSDWSNIVRAILRDQREDAERHGEDLAVVLFGGNVQRIYGPASASGFDERGELPRPFESPKNRSTWHDAGEATRLADSLEVARELVLGQPRAAYHVVVVGDGTYTGADPRPALHLLTSVGARLERVDLPPPDHEETVPGALDLPDEVEIGAPITARFEVFHAPGEDPPKPSVTLFPLYSREPIEVPVPIGLVPDEDGYLRWRVRTEIGPARSGWNRVEIQGMRPYSLKPNADREVTSRGGVRGGEARLLALVGPRSRSYGSPTTPDWPLPNGRGLEGAGVWPQELASQIERFDLVVTLDVPPRDLPIAILRSFVERGGGWLAMIDADSLSSFAARRAEEVLPLVPPRDEPGVRDVIFVVDRSGSMAGEASESVLGAVFALIDAALPSDAVELRWFSDRLSPAIHLIGPEDPKHPGAREEARRLASDRVFGGEFQGGPTALLRALGQLAEERTRADRESLVFLLTDGLDNTDPDPIAASPIVLDRLRAARAKLVVIAVGQLVDWELLARLVGPNQRLEEVASLLDPNFRLDLQRLFQRELNRERIREGGALPILPAEGERGLAAEILEAMRPALAAEKPSVSRYVRAESTIGAEVLWVSDTGEPLLALQRLGLGISAACVLPFDPEQTDESSSELGDLLEPLLRVMARGTRRDRPEVRVEGDHLVVRGLPEDSPADLEARVFGSHTEGAAAPSAVISLSPPIEGGDPRRVRRGKWPSSAADALSTLWEEGDRRRVSARAPRVEIHSRGTAATSWTPIHLALELPGAVEFVLPRPRIPPFESIVVGRPKAGEARPKPHPSAPWILLSGLLLLAGAGFAGTFSRRVR